MAPNAVIAQLISHLGWVRRMSSDPNVRVECYNLLHDDLSWLRIYALAHGLQVDLSLALRRHRA